MLKGQNEESLAYDSKHCKLWLGLPWGYQVIRQMCAEVRLIHRPLPHKLDLSHLSVSKVQTKQLRYVKKHLGSSYYILLK